MKKVPVVHLLFFIYPQQRGETAEKPLCDLVNGRYNTFTTVCKISLTDKLIKHT
jgi:hypothetical protein